MRVKKRNLMVNLPGKVYAAKPIKRPFFYPEELIEVMTQQDKFKPRVSKTKMKSMFDVLPHVVHG